MTVYYAGVGSRTTPSLELAKMQEFAYHAARQGWTLRSGAAQGADATFELGCDDFGGSKEIFLPWALFNGHTSPLYTPSDGALKLAKEIHPAWDYLSIAAKRLVARNMHQILGKNLNAPVGCVVCWTPDGCESADKYGKKTGGTGTAIVLASLNDIPVFNIRNADRYIDAIEFLLTN